MNKWSMAIPKSIGKPAVHIAHGEAETIEKCNEESVEAIKKWCAENNYVYPKTGIEWDI